MRACACTCSLSEAPAVDLGDGVGRHRAADARAGGGALGHGVMLYGEF